MYKLVVFTNSTVEVSNFNEDAVIAAAAALDSGEHVIIINTAGSPRSMADLLIRVELLMEGVLLAASEESYNENE